MIFSHGLAGMRTTYSHFCAEFASRGFIVAAIEHRDGSASTSYKPPSWMLYDRPDERKKPHGQAVEDYLLEFRRKQLDFKEQEVFRVVETLKLLNVGDISQIQQDGNIDHDNRILEMFNGRINFNHMVISGHSFGAATALTVLQNPQHEFKCGILLDPWMHAVSTDKIVNVPYVSIQSETFHWKTNLDSMKELQQSSSKTDDCVFAMIKNTAHQDFSDLPILFPSLMKKLKQGGTDARRALMTCISLILPFLEKHVSIKQSPIMSEVKSHDHMDLLFEDDAFVYLYDRLERNTVTPY